MAFAAALSQHPVTATAAGEVVGAVLEEIGPGPDLAVLFVTVPHGGALDDVAAVVRDVLSPTVLLGCVAESVAGPGQEVEQTAAVSLWAGHVGLLAPIALGFDRETGAVTGWPDDLAFDPNALLVLGDPFTFPMDDFLRVLHDVAPGLPVAGGMASGGRAPGTTRLLLGEQVFTSGAVGVALGPGIGVETVVSQGCRPIGQPYVVTKAEGNVIQELAGQPAFARFTHMVERELDDTDRTLLRGGVHLGVVIDEHRAEFGPGDFLVRNVLGADRSTGAIAVADVVPVGTTVQFHVRDAHTADDELRRMLAGAGDASGALLFTCNGRGSHLFSTPHHDAEALAEATSGAPSAGFFAAGEIGPVGGRNFLHGFTASVVLFRDG